MSLYRSGRIRASSRGFVAPPLISLPPSGIQYYNGAKPATNAWDVQTKVELLAAIDSAKQNGTLNKKIYLRGKSSGNNYAMDTGTGRRFDMPSGCPAGLQLIAANHDDLPLFSGGDAWTWNAGAGVYQNGWMNMNGQAVTMDGFEVADDESVTHGDLYRIIFDNLTPGNVFDRYFIHGTLNGQKPQQVKAFQWFGGGTGGLGLILRNGIFAELMGGLMVKNGANNVATSLISQLRMGEHAWKGENGFTNWTNDKTLFDRFIPGSTPGINPPDTIVYDDHANGVYLGGSAGNTLETFTLDDALLNAGSDGALGQLIRVEPNGATSNNIKVRNARWWGNVYIAYSGVSGTGNEISGVTGVGIDDGLYQEGAATKAYIRADNSTFLWSNNDARWSDQGSNTITGSPPASGTGGSLVHTAVANAAFEAAAAARQQRTCLTLGL
jgi:hypothetical protein